MKKSIFTIAFAIVTSGVLITSCSSPAEKLEDSGENLEEAKENLDRAEQEHEEQYEILKSESNEEITSNEKLIADLKEFSKSKKNEAKITYDATILTLEMKNEEMKQKIDTYNYNNAGAWESFKEEFNKDMDELGQSLSNFNDKENK
jgi:chromosome segregation ATPase